MKNLGQGTSPASVKPAHAGTSVRPDSVAGLARPSAKASPLSSLNAHMAQASQAAADQLGTRPDDEGAPWPDLRSTRRFRETWARLGAEVQVQQAQARAPHNAGPLNPQRLMLDTLARMGELSPHYLRRFLAHAETLLWLEQVQGQMKSTGQRPGESARKRKAERPNR